MNRLDSADPIELVAPRREEGEISDRNSTVTFHRVGADELYVGGGELLKIEIHEIIQNAIEHSDRRPEIHIDVTENPDPSRSNLVSRDNGPGIDTLELTSLETGKETPLEHGSGLGLWLVKWAISSIGGNVVFIHIDPGSLTVEL